MELQFLKNKYVQRFPAHRKVEAYNLAKQIGGYVKRTVHTYMRQGKPCLRNLQVTEHFYVYKKEEKPVQ